MAEEPNASSTETAESQASTATAASKEKTKVKPASEKKKSKLLRFGEWLFGYLLPLYLIVGSLCFIAAPKLFSDAPAKTSASAPKTAQPYHMPPLGQPAEAAASGPTAQELKIADIVRIAMESSRERIESIKEGNDKLFSVISALAALLVFLGFKGVETFRSLNSQAEETVEKSRVALETAEETTKNLNNFVDNRYTKDNTAEINVSQGLVLKEMGELYRKLAYNGGPPTADAQTTYCNYLNDAIGYLNRVADHPEGIDKKIVSRALIIRGNIFKLLGKPSDALASVLLANEKYDKNDSASFYNAACYSCLLAKQAAASNNHGAAAKHEIHSLSYLRKAVAIDPSLALYAATDDDFAHFTGNTNAQFLAMTASSPQIKSN